MFKCTIMGREVVAQNKRLRVVVSLSGGPAGKTAKISLRWNAGSSGPKDVQLSSSGAGLAGFYPTFTTGGTSVSVTASASSDGRDAAPATLRVRVV
jgi:hypothetical protein